jgi:hypothetical protein
MTQYTVKESGLKLQTAMPCAFCRRLVRYVDALDGEVISCISCTYIHHHEKTDQTVIHEAPFDLADADFLAEALRVNEFDVHPSPSDGTGRTVIVKMKLSMPTAKRLTQLAEKHGLPPFVEVETALSWFLAMVETASPEEVRKRLIPEKEQETIVAPDWKEGLPATG